MHSSLTTPLYSRSMKCCCGFGLLEGILSLTILISLLSLGSKYFTWNLDKQLYQTTAQQLQQLSQGVYSYSSDHFSEIQQQLQDGNPIVWNQDDIERNLTQQGYLSNRKILENHPYQHNYQVTLLLHPSQPQLLQMMVLTQEGQAISENALRQIASLAGPMAGYISAITPKQITGGQAGWQLPLTDSLQATPGHLATLQYLNQHDLQSVHNLYLYRKKIPGHGEYNQMDANLVMNADILLADGSKITFNGDKNLIQKDKIKLESGWKSIQLEPGFLQIKKNNGKFEKTINTDGEISAEGSITSGYNITSGNGIYGKLMELNFYGTRNKIDKYGLKTEATGKLPFLTDDFTSRSGGALNPYWLEIPFYISNKFQEEKLYKICEYDGKKTLKMFLVIYKNYNRTYLYTCLPGETNPQRLLIK